MIENNKINKTFSINDEVKYISTPSIEITHFDKLNKESKKEVFPISKFLDSECHNLKFNNILN
tara:strand:+ start:225 stop:413 length:189 start_codon:yes stop_codon:yes gene_type:complete